MTTLDKLARLQNYATRYELIATDGTQMILLCYSVRRSRQIILETLRKHGPAILQLVNAKEDSAITFEKPASRGVRIGNWAFRFTGRTQREAIIAGEHPFIGTLTSIE